MIRPAEVVLPILRTALPGISVVTYFNDADHRRLPLVQVRPLGGVGHDRHPELLDVRVIELSAHTATDLAATEELWDSAWRALHKAWLRQTVVADKGWICSIEKNMGATQSAPIFEDSWRVLGLIQLGLRPTHPDL